MKKRSGKDKSIKISISVLMAVICACSLTACSFNVGKHVQTETAEETAADPAAEESAEAAETAADPMAEESAEAAETAADPAAEETETAADAVTMYTDVNGDSAPIPAEFRVSDKEDEQTIGTGLVVIGPDDSEFVWVPTTVTSLSVREFGSYFSGSGSINDYYDETDLPIYQEMAASTEKYGGFYMGRYEASQGENGLPVSRQVSNEEPGRIWVQFAPQDATVACQNLYPGNDTVQGFFPWGANWDTTLQWMIDSGALTEYEVTSDSTGWGNYSNDSFSEGARGNYTGVWEEAEVNNIYDLAGNNWEWTQERCGSNYVMRGGGYSLMGGGCPGDCYPAALRDPLPGNNHHPNVVFRPALYVI